MPFIDPRKCKFYFYFLAKTKYTVNKKCSMEYTK